jgi:hypothetical protein
MSQKIDVMPFNAGAIIGVVLGGLLALAFLYYTEWDFSRRDVKFATLFPVLGYPVGSLAWDWAFSKNE